MNPAVPTPAAIQPGGLRRARERGSGQLPTRLLRSSGLAAFLLVLLELHRYARSVIQAKAPPAMPTRSQEGSEDGADRVSALYGTIAPV